MPELPLVRAIEYRRDLPSGTTQPCVFLCESANGDTEEYVTKMRHSVRDSGLGFECIAFHLARHFGIESPSAALVQLPLDLAVAQKHNEKLCDRIIRSVGLNFGSVFMPGFTTWLPARRLSVGLLQKAAEILAFDALIENPDRRREKPNLLVGPLQLLVIDHELAFSFLRTIGGAGPWFQKIRPLIVEHPFYGNLRGSSLELGRFRERLLALDDRLIEDICFGIPKDFEFAHSERIAQHLMAARLDADRFIEGIAEVLR